MDILAYLMIATINKELSSKDFFKTIFQKIIIFFIIAVSVLIDNLFPSVNLRHIVIVFYIINEALAIIESAIKLGLPIPNKIKIVFNELKNEDNSK